MSEEVKTGEAGVRSGDALGTYDGGSSSSRRAGRGEAALTDADISAAVTTIAKANGMATMVSEADYTVKITAVRKLFNARDTVQKRDLDMVLVYYFAVHGTSPETEWATYPYPLVSGGIAIKAYDVVSAIGPGILKKFMARYSSLALDMVRLSPELRGALSERAARAGAQPGEEHLAIDFIGKDGSLDTASMSRRIRSKEMLLHRRANNLHSIAGVHGTQRAVQAAGNGNDIRSGGSLPASAPVLSFD